MIMGALYLHRRQHGENVFATIAGKFGGVPVTTIKVRAPVTAIVAVESLPQQNAAHLVHGGTNRHFAGFQVQVFESLAILQDTRHEAIYLLFRFSAKRLRSFFSTPPVHFRSRCCGLDASDIVDRNQLLG